MPSGRYKSRRYRRVFKRPPSGKTKLHYVSRKPGNAKCALCGDVLKGIPRGTANQMKGLSRSKKRSQRPYGGNLCSRCTRKKIIEMVRKEQ